MFWLSQSNFTEYGIAGAVIATVLIFVGYLRNRDVAAREFMLHVTDVIKENSKFIGKVSIILQRCQSRCDLVIREADEDGSDNS